MPRGGRRQGVQGRSYSNRTDLMQDYRPSAPAEQPIAVPAGSGPAQGLPSPVPVFADQIPNIGDPTADDRPVTDGIPVGPGAMGMPPVEAPYSPDPVRLTLQAAMIMTDNLDLARILHRLDMEGR